MKPITQKFFAELNKRRPSKINLSLVDDLRLKEQDVLVFSNNVTISIEKIREINRYRASSK